MIKKMPVFSLPFAASTSLQSCASACPLYRGLRLVKLSENGGVARKKASYYRIRRTDLRAELSHDAPFAAAIGACVVASLVAPIFSGGSDDDDDDVEVRGGDGFDSMDARFGVMTIIGFIPYFNWLSWVFAWLDSGEQRYLLYSIVYLAPYLRTNLHLSPDESWLPIASILVCIIHIQLEANIKNEGVQGIPFFSEIQKLIPPLLRKKKATKGSRKSSDKVRLEDGLPSPHEIMEKLRRRQFPDKIVDEQRNRTVGESDADHDPHER